MATESDFETKSDVTRHRLKMTDVKIAKNGTGKVDNMSHNYIAKTFL